MIHDINDLEPGSEILADICIVGGGAAGIAIAQALSETQLRVCVLESGELNMDSKTQALYDGSSSGAPYFPLDDSRCRLFGGSTYRWGARGAPMHEFDFALRDWIKSSGWPIGHEEVKTYYSSAEKLIGMHESFAYDENIWSLIGSEPLNIDRTKLKYQAFQFGKTVLFGHFYRDVFKHSRNVDVYLNANVTEIRSNQKANHIQHVDIKTLKGKTYRAQAKIFVLACGGIENPRLLLASNSICERGLCNDNDLVGRFFMEHPTVPVGTIDTTDKQRITEHYSPGRVAGRLVEVGMALTPEIQEQEQTLNAYARVKPALAPDATQALREIVWDLLHRRFRPGYSSRIFQVIKDPIGITRNAYRHLMNKPKHYKIDSVFVEIRTEQAPNPDSRVTLTEDIDALGMSKPHLNWQLTDLDKHTMQVITKIFAKQLDKSGHGTLIPDEWVLDDAPVFPAEMVGGHHHMGTTRMADSPTNGVVDKNCKAHGIDNLFVAGSSVFPTVGFVNPTLTILALSLRLVDHIRSGPAV